MSKADNHSTTLPATITTPTPVVMLVDGEPMADSREISLRFGKRHDHVLRSIDALVASGEDLGYARFAPASYDLDVLPKNGEEGRSHVRTHRCYRMNEAAFSLVVMGFTGGKALRWKVAYATAFRAMETELRARQAPAPALDLNDPAALRGLLLGYSEQLLAARAEVAQTRQALVVTEQRAAVAETVIAETRPAVEFYHQFAEAGGLYNLQNAGRALGAPPNGFVAWLRKAYLFNQGGSLVPKAPFIKMGLFEVRVVIVNDVARSQSLVTPWGLTYLAKAWAKAEAEKRRAASEQDLFGNAA
ncbi:hypothetical protein ASF49_08220 [Methylobacterium sp. Leaf104]|uniref:phage regulatory protein/antirepressor Ant n=1 Tax=Methylobacterium TaxID=407 RepID=UPI0006FE09A7|nr:MULTISPECIES: phage regulatory protein/antirepressor Ant [Methylobacterium]KQP33843.1 hypothetical protein ASF49_08220 [Methylobacterium sp. Leaf104]MCI9879588.1 phage regulatory protein/antirepressor Ant [Methylobacterium goesingense]